MDLASAEKARHTTQTPVPEQSTNSAIEVDLLSATVSAAKESASHAPVASAPVQNDQDVTERPKRKRKYTRRGGQRARAQRARARARARLDATAAPSTDTTESARQTSTNVSRAWIEPTYPGAHYPAIAALTLAAHLLNAPVKRPSAHSRIGQRPQRDHPTLEDCRASRRRDVNRHRHQAREFVNSRYRGPGTSQHQRPADTRPHHGDRR
jgi:hypothetical protein